MNVDCVMHNLIDKDTKLLHSSTKALNIPAFSYTDIKKKKYKKVLYNHSVTTILFIVNQKTQWN